MMRSRPSRRLRCFRPRRPAKRPRCPPRPVPRPHRTGRRRGTRRRDRGRSRRTPALCAPNRASRDAPCRTGSTSRIRSWRSRRRRPRRRRTARGCARSTPGARRVQRPRGRTRRHAPEGWSRAARAPPRGTRAGSRRDRRTLRQPARSSARAPRDSPSSSASTRRICRSRSWCHNIILLNKTHF